MSALSSLSASAIVRQRLELSHIIIEYWHEMQAASREEIRSLNNRSQAFAWAAKQGDSTVVVLALLVVVLHNLKLEGSRSFHNFYISTLKTADENTNILCQQYNTNILL